MSDHALSVTTRRKFIQNLAAAALTLGTSADALGKPRAKSSPRFTLRVRAKTKGLHLVPGRWRWVVAHHSGIAYGNAAIYDRQHRKRGMENGLAYHFVIGNGIDSGDGEIEIGGRWLKQLKGGHVHREEINEVAIGICLVGNFETTSPTTNQMLAFRELMNYLLEVVGKLHFAVHSEIDPEHTACPGRHFPTAQMHRLYGRFISLI
jgi:hypothetical protein